MPEDTSEIASLCILKAITNFFYILKKKKKLQ